MAANFKPPISHFFTELDKVEPQEISQAFGPEGTIPASGDISQASYSDKKFQLTNIFFSKQNLIPKAFAVVSGILFIVPQKGNPDLVNIFLKPTDPVALGLKIKYYVYRGVRKGNYFDAGGSGIDKLLQKNDPNILPFLNKIWDEFLEFNQIPLANANTVAFEAKKMGFSTTDLATYKSFFSKGKYTLPNVTIGNHIGNFGAEFGFEIVVDEGDYSQERSDTGFEFKDDFFRAKKCILNVDSPTNLNLDSVYGNLPNTVSEKIFRESVYLFLDPAAYYGSHVTINNDKNEGEIVVSIHPKLSWKKPRDIYDNIITKFFNKSKTYLYIKGKRGRSYNFFPSDPIISNPIEITGNPDNNFKDNQWPLRILNHISFLSFKLNVFSLNCSMVCHIGMGAKFIYKNSDLLAGVASPNPSPSLINFPLPTDARFPANNLSSIIYLSYNDGNEPKLNNLFGNINLKSIFEQADFSTEQGSFVNFLRTVLIEEDGDIGMYQTKLVLEGKYIASTNPPVLSYPITDSELTELSTNLRTYILFPQNSTLEQKDNKPKALTAGYYIASNLEEYISEIYGSGEIWKGVISDGSSITSLQYFRKDNDNNQPIYQLGISQKEYLFLEGKAKELDSDATNFYFYLEEHTIVNSNTFIKYKLKMQFDKKDGTLGQTTDSVSLYTTDGYFFFTTDYSINFNLKYKAKEFPKVTAEFLPRSNYNGEFGFDWLRKGDLITESIADKPFNKIISDHYKTSNHSILEDDVNEWKGFYKFNILKYLKLKNKGYHTLPVNWKLSSESNDYEKDSAVSYLNLYRKDVSPNPRAKLRLLIRVKNKPNKMYIRYPKNLFAIRLGDNITIPDNNPINGIYRTLYITNIPDNDKKDLIDLEIENIADLTQDTEITIHTDIGEICGRMIVIKNDDVIRKKVIVIQLRDNLPVSTTALGAQDANVNIVSDIKKILSHANIEPDYETPYIVINTIGNTEFQGLIIDDSAPYELLASGSTSHNNNLKVPFRIKMTVSTPNTPNPVSSYITNAFNNYLESFNPPKLINDYRNHLILIFTDRYPTVLPDGTSNPAFRYSNFLFITQKTKDYDIAHEFLHGFEIDHTFYNESLFTYMHGKYSLISANNTLLCTNTDNDITDNIMDYFNDPKKSTFKWQWDIMRKSIKNLK